MQSWKVIEERHTNSKQGNLAANHIPILPLKNRKWRPFTFQWHSDQLHQCEKARGGLFKRFGLKAVFD
jgi:hypothetical protein